MRKKFLIFPLLFVFGLLVFLGYPKVSFAVAPTITTDAASASTTTATLNGTVTNNGGVDATGVGFSTGTAAGIYNSSSTQYGTWTTAATFSYAQTGLSMGTVYYVMAYASNTDGWGYGSEANFLTGVDYPTSLTATDIGDTAITFTWATSSGDGIDKVMISYNSTNTPTSITDGVQGCHTNDKTCTVTGLSHGTTYYFAAWGSTTDVDLGTELATSSEVSATLSVATDVPATSPGGGGRSFIPPTTYADSLVIEGGAGTTPDREVVLSLRVSNVLYMTICNRSDLVNCWLEDYKETKSWTLTAGEGEKTVYAKFLSPDGMNSEVVSDTIVFEAAAAEEAVEEEVIEEEVVEEEAVEEEVVEEVAEEVEEEEVVEEEVTAEGLRAQIEALQTRLLELLRQLIQVLQGQLSAVGQFFAALFGM